MDQGSDLDRRIAGIAALDQPLRRDLYRLLADGAWHSRDDAAAALDQSRSVAAFHLDKLADAGVVDVRFERLTGRRGPGAGRPSKLYRLAAAELAASVPERHYDLAGSLLAGAVAEAGRSGRPVRECLREAARAAGRRVGDEAGGDVLAALAGQGYEPEPGPRGGDGIALANCPFHRLAEQERDLVCGMNLDFVSGLLEGLAPGGGRRARLDPTPGYCCVRIATT